MFYSKEELVKITIGLSALLVIFVSILFGVLISHSSTSLKLKTLKAQAIEHNCAEYNTVDGQWGWKE